MKRVDSRTFLAITLILIGFLTAIILALLASHKNGYIVSNHAMVPGHIVNESDIRIEKAALWGSVDQYLTENVPIIGSVVTRFIGSNELMLTEMLASENTGTNYFTVPLSVAGADLPINLQVGQTVNIYQVISPNDVEGNSSAKLIVESIRILTIDRKGQNLGNSVLISVAAPESQIKEILNATKIGRIVIVSTTT